MNKKLLVMVMVPVLVVMSGALAFSAFTGSITTQVNASAGYISFNQEAFVYNYSASNTVVSVDGTSLSIPSSTSFMPISLGWAGLDSQNTNTSSQTITVKNLAPGNYVTLEFNVINNGSVGFEVSAEPTSYTVSPSTDAYNEVPAGLGINPWPAFMSDMSITHGYIYYVYQVNYGSIDVGHSATYFVGIGLGSPSGNHYQESSFSLTVSTTVTSDA